MKIAILSLLVASLLTLAVFISGTFKALKSGGAFEFIMASAITAVIAYSFYLCYRGLKIRSKNFAIWGMIATNTVVLALLIWLAVSYVFFTNP